MPRPGATGFIQQNARPARILYKIKQFEAGKEGYPKKEAKLTMKDVAHLIGLWDQTYNVTASEN